jgi:tetratricopeptide (TPR) repeat protein
VSPSPAQRWLQLALVCACAALAFANTLANGFVWDDQLLVLSNPWLEGPQHLGDIFGTHFWGFASRGDLSRNYYRPLVHVTLLLCRAAFGLQPWGYHLVMLLGHMAVSGLVYRVGLLFCAQRPGGWLAALAAGLLFAVHPIHTEAVAWVAAINDVAMALGVLLALYLLMTSTPGLTLRSALAGLAFLFALLFKEPAVLLLGMVGVWDVMRGGRAWSLRQWLGRYAPLAVALVLYAALRIHALAGLGRTVHHSSLGTAGYVLNALPLLAQHLGALALPLELNSFHVFEPVDSPWAPQVLSGLAALASLAIAAAVFWRRAPSALVALAWCLLPLLPVLYIPALGSNTFAERYLYLPSVGFLLLVGMGLEALGRRPLVLGALAVGVLAGGAATASRNTVWHDNLSLWLDVQSKSPEAPEIHEGLGLALLDRGRTAEAIAHLERAPRNSAPALRNLGVAYAREGRLQEAEATLGQAVRLEPDNAGAWSNLCLVHKNLKQFPRALEECGNAARLAPHLPEVRTSFGQVLLLTGRWDEAEQSLQAALALKPDFTPARRLLERVALERQRAASPPGDAAGP